MLENLMKMIKKSDGKVQNRMQMTKPDQNSDKIHLTKLDNPEIKAADNEKPASATKKDHVTITTSSSSNAEDLLGLGIEENNGVNGNNGFSNPGENKQNATDHLKK